MGPESPPPKKKTCTTPIRPSIENVTTVDEESSLEEEETGFCTPEDQMLKTPMSPPKNKRKRKRNDQPRRFVRVKPEPPQKKPVTLVKVKKEPGLNDVIDLASESSPSPAQRPTASHEVIDLISDDEESSEDTFDPFESDAEESDAEEVFCAGIDCPNGGVPLHKEDIGSPLTGR